MSDEQLTEEQILQQVQKGPHWRNLEKARDEAVAEAAKFKGLFETARGQLLSSAAQIAGFTPNEKGEFEGIPGLLIEKFQGSLGAEDLPDPSALATLAESYELKPSTPSGDDGKEQPPVNDIARLLASAQQGGDMLAALGGAPQPADLAARIAEAEKSGDVATSIALKQQLAYGDATPAVA